MEKRTIQLTHTEVATILRALGVAEKMFSEIRTNYINKVVNVRGIDSRQEAIDEANIMVMKENEYSDLFDAIKGGEKDV